MLIEKYNILNDIRQNNWRTLILTKTYKRREHLSLKVQNVELVFDVSVGGHILRRKIKHRMHLGRKIDIEIS